jgi:basic amino acid/polyamine antiporter, APA family
VRRVLTTFDATCIGVNAIVGSGIYLFPGRLSAALGPASVVAWVATGLLCLPLAFTYAVLGAGEDRAGGSFRYTQRAFGTAPAFAVGWSAWVTALISWAAVASGLPGYLAPFLPGLSQGIPARLFAAGIVAAFTLLNVVGVKPGARLTDALTLVKLVPLVAFVVLGLFAVDPARFKTMPQAGLVELPAMTLMIMFAYQGFEVVGIPAGELDHPRRAVPRAVLGAMMGSALLYALIQFVFVGVGGGSTALPLPDAARSFLGPAGATLLGAGGLVSMLGFNAGTALCTPRYLEALAEERLVPPGLARLHARFQTPALAIVASGGIAFVLALVLDFERLVDLAVLAVLVQYLASSLSLVRLATTRNQRLLGLVSAAISVGFALECQPIEGLVLGGLLAVGGAVALATRRALERERARS